MKKLLYIFLGVLLSVGGTVFAAAQPSYTPSLLPLQTDTYYLGSTSPNLEYNGLYVKNINISGTCTGPGCSTGGTGNPGGSNGQVQYNASGSFGGVSTTTVTAGTNMSFTPFTIIGSTPITINATGGSGTFPFTSNVGYNSTSTVIGFNGLFSTASSTFSGNVFLPALSQGNLYLGSLGLVQTSATTSLSVGSPLTVTGTFGALIGGTNSTINCQVASGSQAGCLSSADWTTFNNKGSGTVTSVVAGAGFQNQGLNITSSGTLVGAFASSSVPSLSNIPYVTGIGDASNPIKLGFTATGTVNGFGGITASGASVLGGNLSITCGVASSGSSGCINLGTSQTWTVNQNFNYSSSTIYSSFLTSSSTFARAGTFTLEPAVIIGPGCAAFNASGQLADSGILCGTVTSVGLSSTNSTLTVGSTPVTGAGTITADLNLGHTNTWTILQNFNYSSSTVYSSFLTASSTFQQIGTLTLSTSTAGCLNTSSTGVVYAATCASGGGSGDSFTHPLLGLSATTSQFIVGTSTAASYQLTVASSTAPQIALSAGAGVAQWAIRNAGGNLYFATTTVAGTATSTQAAFSEVGSGAPTLGIGTSTSFAVLSAVNTSGSATPLFAIASSTATGAGLPNFEIDGNGHEIYSGPKPTCDANCTMTAGNDNRFRITTGTTITQTTVTFAHSWGIAPVCFADEGSAGTVNADASSTPTTVVISLASALTTKDIEVWCDGIQ